MKVKYIKLTELQQLVYKKIVEQETLYCYWQYENFWYVTRYNESSYIHYATERTKDYLKISFLISGEKTISNYKPETIDTVLMPLTDEES